MPYVSKDQLAQAREMDLLTYLRLHEHNFCKKLQDFNGIIVIHCETIQSMFHMFKYTISYLVL